MSLPSHEPGQIASFIMRQEPWWIPSRRKEHKKYKKYEEYPPIYLHGAGSILFHHLP
jgi:hypothetical protein